MHLRRPYRRRWRPRQIVWFSNKFIPLTAILAGANFGAYPHPAFRLLAVTLSIALPHLGLFLLF